MTAPGRVTRAQWGEMYLGALPSVLEGGAFDFSSVNTPSPTEGYLLPCEPLTSILLTIRTDMV
jgi:hypothetical protein